MSLGIAVALLLGPTARSAFSQAKPAPTGTLNVTIVDPSGAVISGATVIVTGAEDATAAATPPSPARTSSQGIAAITGLVPGRYTVQGSFPGFETRLVKDVRV